MAIRNLPSPGNRSTDRRKRSRSDSPLRQVDRNLLVSNDDMPERNGSMATYNPTTSVEMINKPRVPYDELLSECDAWMDLFNTLRSSARDDESLMKMARGLLKSVIHDKGPINEVGDDAFECAAGRIKGLVTHYLDTMAEKFVGPLEPE